MSGKPDLTLHTLSHFLDRFIYRTPKTSQGARGASIMQPLAGGDTSDRLVVAGQAAAHAPLNSEAFWKKRADEVAAEDVFFHEYFNRVGKDKEKARVKKEGKGPVARGEEDGSDDESEIWKALVDSRPELEGADSDDDLDMDDLESAYDADEKDDEDGQDGSDDEGVVFNDESDPEDDEPEDNMPEDWSTEAPVAKPKDTKAKPKPSDEDEDDDFDMDVSDEDAFVGSDEELPFGINDISDDGDEGEEQGKDQDQDKKDDNGEGKKKRKLKHLPTFASADDYAELLAGEDDGM